MLARELNLQDSDKGYILVQFPENYRLYEHVKSVKKTDDQGKAVTATKTHAGGGNDRQDAYLYGHPMGRKKRFRSPADYFPHLLWLSTDEEGDADNCTCKICCPEELDEKPAPTVTSQAPAKSSALPTPTTATTTGQSAATSTPAPNLSARNPSVDAVRRASTTGAQERNPPSPALVNQPARSTSTTPLQPASHHTVRQAPTTIPQPQPQSQQTTRPAPVSRSRDHEQDLSYDNYIFRQGEMVWYNRGAAWGLAVITQRWRLPNDPAKAYFRVQPLSWPGAHLPAETKSTADLRPWLAWSVPPFTNNGLNSLPGLSWDTVDWYAISSGKFGQGEIGVDGSILAAKNIDSTYTTISLESKSEPTPGVTELRWNAIFIGAEKVWVGDTVRIKSADPTTIHVLVIREIVERTQSSAFNGQSWKRLELVGDVFVHAEVRYNNNRQPTPQGAIKQGITKRMQEDTVRRNPHTVGAKGTAAYWNTVPGKQNARFETKDVKGRWYEATLLLPLLKGPAAYENDMRQGIIQEVGTIMNAKGDCNGGAVPDMRKIERKDALGGSVPPDFRLIDGDAPPQLPPQPQRPQAQQQVHHQQPQQQQQQQQISLAQQAHHQMNMNGAGLSAVATTGASSAPPNDPTFEFMDMDSMDGGHDMTAFGGNQNFY